MASAFKSAAEELNELSLFQAALFIVGLAINAAPQMSLKPAGPCAEHLYQHYILVVRLTWFFAVVAFGVAGITGHVKRRVPDGGLDGVATARERGLLRFHAALGGFLSVAASAFSLVAFTFLVQAKTGAWHCIPFGWRCGMVVTNLVIGYVFCTVYYHVFQQIGLAN